MNCFEENDLEYITDDVIAKNSIFVIAKSEILANKLFEKLFYKSLNEEKLKC